MSEDAPWAPVVLDTGHAHPARVYDYLLGGKDNFLADREAAEAVLKVRPDAAQLALGNRQFLERAIRRIVEAGVDQLIDVGSGLPSGENTYEIARAVNAASRVLYVDRDPIVLAHGRALLASAPAAGVVAGDARDPDTILASPEVRQFIDFERPLGVVFGLLLHYLTDEEAAGLVRAFALQMQPGSFVVISHVCDDGREETAAGLAIYRETTAPLYPRSPEQLIELLAVGGLTVLEPGVTPVTRWPLSGHAAQSEDVVAVSPVMAAVARLGAAP